MKLRTFFILFLLFIIGMFATISKAQAQEQFNLPMNKTYTNVFGETAEFMVGYPGLFNGEPIVYIPSEEPYEVSIYLILAETPQVTQDSTRWITDYYEVDRIVLSNRAHGITETLRGEDLFIKQVGFMTIVLDTLDFYTEDHEIILRNGNIKDYYR